MNWMVTAAVLAAFGLFWCGWALGSWRTGVNDFRLVMELVRLEPKEPEPAPAKMKPAEPTPDALRREEELQRMQDLLDNIDAYGTDVPQKEIKERKA